MKSATKLPSPENLAKELARRRRNALNIPELKARQTALEDALNAQTIVLEAFKAQQALMDQVAELPFDDLRAMLSQMSQDADSKSLQTMDRLASIVENTRAQTRGLEDKLARLEMLVSQLPTSIPEPERVDLSGLNEQISDVRRNMMTELPNLQVQIGSMDLRVVERDENGDIERVTVT